MAVADFARSLNDSRSAWLNPTDGDGLVRSTQRGKMFLFNKDFVSVYSLLIHWLSKSTAMTFGIYSARIFEKKPSLHPISMALLPCRSLIYSRNMCSFLFRYS